MKKIILGKTGIEVTELCFGALPMGPLQKNMPAEESAEVVAEALRLGVTFVDTAQAYKTYSAIRSAIEKTGIRPVIATKCMASSYEDMEAAVSEARAELGLDVLDIFLLHAARADENVFKQREGALRCLLDHKEKGVIKAVGISSHNVLAIKKAAENPNIDIVFPIINKTGMGVISGTREDMENVISESYERGKGVYLMKILAGGNLVGDYVSSMEYGRKIAAGKAAVAIGMVSAEEVRMNVGYFNGEDVSSEAGKLKSTKAFYVVPVVCAKCGKCAAACHSDAIIWREGEISVIDDNKCLRCGYCVDACPQFAIRMI